MADTQSNIFVNIKTLFESGGITKMKESLQGIRSVSKQTGLSMIEVRAAAKQLGLGINGMGKVVGKNGQVLKNQEGYMKKLTNATANLSDPLAATVSRFRGMSRVSEQTGMSMFHTGLAARESGTQFNGLGQVMGKTGKAYKNQKKELRSFSKSGMRPFRGDLLGIMFLAQGVSATFGGMIKTVLQMTGVFEVFQAVLIDILGPVLFPLAEKMIDLMDKMMDLSPETKKIIGEFVLFIAIISGLVAAIAPVLLLFSFWGLTFTKFITWITMGAKGLTAFGNVFAKLGGAITFVWGIFRIFSGWLNSDWWKVVSGILLAIAGIVAFVMGGWIPALIALAVGALVWLGDKFGKVAAIIMAALSPVIAPLTIMYDLIKGIVDMMSGRGFQGFKATGSFFAQIGSKWKGTSLASGGVVTRPTIAQIGEAGPEAVVPLTGPNSGGGFGGSNITVNVNNPSISSGMDADNIGRIIADKMYSELRRLGIR